MQAHSMTGGTLKEPWNFSTAMARASWLLKDGLTVSGRKTLPTGTAWLVGLTWATSSFCNCSTYLTMSPRLRVNPSSLPSGTWMRAKAAIYWTSFLEIDMEKILTSKAESDKRLCQMCNKINDRHVKCLGDPFQGFQGRAVFSAFDPGYIGPLHARLGG